MKRYNNVHFAHATAVAKSRTRQDVLLYPRSRINRLAIFSCAPCWNSTRRPSTRHRNIRDEALTSVGLLYCAMLRSTCELCVGVGEDVVELSSWIRIKLTFHSIYNFPRCGVRISIKVDLLEVMYKQNLLIFCNFRNVDFPLKTGKGWRKKLCVWHSSPLYRIVTHHF